MVRAAKFESDDGVGERQVDSDRGGSSQQQKVAVGQGRTPFLFEKVSNVSHLEKCLLY